MKEISAIIYQMESCQCRRPHAGERRAAGRFAAPRHAAHDLLRLLATMGWLLCLGPRRRDVRLPSLRRQLRLGSRPMPDPPFQSGNASQAEVRVAHRVQEFHGVALAGTQAPGHLADGRLQARATTARRPIGWPGGGCGGPTDQTSQSVALVLGHFRFDAREFGHPSAGSGQALTANRLRVFAQQQRATHRTTHGPHGHVAIDGFNRLEGRPCPGWPGGPPVFRPDDVCFGGGAAFGGSDGRDSINAFTAGGVAAQSSAEMPGGIGSSLMRRASPGFSRLAIAKHGD